MPAKLNKVWSLYKHTLKGEKWSRLSEKDFEKANGKNWIVVKTLKLCEFKNR